VDRRLCVRLGARIGLCQCPDGSRAAQTRIGGLVGQLQSRCRGEAIGDRRDLLACRLSVAPLEALSAARAQGWLIEHCRGRVGMADRAQPQCQYLPVSAQPGLIFGSGYQQ